MAYDVIWFSVNPCYTGPPCEDETIFTMGNKFCFIDKQKIGRNDQIQQSRVEQWDHLQKKNKNNNNEVFSHFIVLLWLGSNLSLKNSV